MISDDFWWCLIISDSMMSHDSWCKVQTVAFVLFFQASVSSQGDSPNRFQPLVLRWKSTSACSAKKVTFRCSIARHDWWRQVMTPMQKPGFRRLLTRFLVVLKDRFFCYVFWDMGRPDSGFWTYEIFPCTSLPQGKTLTLPSTIEDSIIRQARLPIQSSIFEMLVVYNMTQMLFNAFVSSQLLREAWAWLGSSARKPMEHENIYEHIWTYL